jgi:O-methyltransferase
MPNSKPATSSASRSERGTIVRWTSALVLLALVLTFAVLMLRDGGWGERVVASESWRILIVAGTAVLAGMAFGWAASGPSLDSTGAAFTPAHDYYAYGLGPLSEPAIPQQLYLDLMKRAISNIIYEDRPVWYANEQRQLTPARGVDLRLRWNGTDLPTQAHTMIGLRRIDNLRECAETVLRENVPGDFLEAGVLRGGAAIFLRAILKAHGVSDRRVIACDTFVARDPVRPTLAIRLGVRAIKLLASIPSRRWRRRLFEMLQNGPAEMQSFPKVENPSDELVDFVMFMLQNLALLKDQRDRTSLAAVQSHFARFGLLDEQVVFLKGFFSETLPTAPVEHLALLRMDGDTYESTRDVIEVLYSKLSPGGFCIVDDYHSFPDCRRAIDEFRQKNAITDEMVRIDEDAVYWRKEPSETLQFTASQYAAEPVGASPFRE